ncbi:MAG TPA: GNAT family protein [Longimicrobiales bacterium]|nr:GNAT family protein [Longimicrobiales bacterium]
MSLPTLAAPAVVLRPVTDDDVDAVFALFGDADRLRFWGHAPLASRAEAEVYVEGIRQGATTGTLLQWAVCASGDGPVDEEAPLPVQPRHGGEAAGARPLLGTCTLAGIDRSHRRAELGVALLPEAMGRGLATAAARTAIAYAFEELGLHRITADADPRNAPALALLERLGFRREGVLREHYRHGEEWQDGVLFGLLRTEAAP